MNKLKIVRILVGVLLYLSFMVVTINAGQPIEVYVYDFPGFQGLEKIINYFSKLPEVKTTIYYLNDSFCLNEFLEIVDLLITHGIQVLPPNFCTPCEMAHGLDWRDIYVRYSSPLLLFFQDGKLTTIVISRYDIDTLDQARACSGDIVKIFLRDRSISSLDENARIRIEQLFKEKKRPRANVFQFLPLIIAAASTEAINLYEFFALADFISSIIIRLKRRAVLKFRITYSAVIFLTYFTVGLGVCSLIGYVYEAKIFVVILGSFIGSKSILNLIFGFLGLSIGLRELISRLLNRRYKHILIPLSEKLSGRLRRFAGNQPLVLITGVTSAFLLPCTSGPYLIALSLIADLKSLVYEILFLFLYNGIVIVSFLTITAEIYSLKLKTSGLKKQPSTKHRRLNILGGLLMIALSIYLIIYAL